MTILEFSLRTISFHLNLLQLLKHEMSLPVPELPPMKTFKPKYKLPLLQSYKTKPDKTYWEIFPTNYKPQCTSLVDPIKLKALALDTGFQDLSTLDKICVDLTYGADIGCRGSARTPSFSTNAPSAYEFAPHVSDAIADWLNKGFAYGPVPIEQIPPTAKVNGIMTKPKPNGSVRIILNLSAPLGNCVNEGIDKDEFPTIMSSTTKWLRALHLAGRKAKMCKIDWADAYKHVAVSAKDTDLQWFSWLGFGFKELCLIFGCVSSAGIFDRLAKVVVHIVATKSNFPVARICQHLDDCCATAPAGSDSLEVFDNNFTDIASQLGVKLAPRDDPEKSFGPSTHGLVLGIVYDTVHWTWALNHEKLARILNDMQKFLTSDHMPQSAIWSIVGKIIHIQPLIPYGRFNMHHLLDLNSHSLNKNTSVQLTPNFKKQIYFWFTMIKLCSGRGKLLNPDKSLPPWAIEVYTDAAGGSMNTVGLGVGAVTDRWWSYVPWSRAININKTKINGRYLGRCMSALELVGPLLAISAGFSWAKNSPIKFWVDNAASVFIYKKGYSRSCPLSTCIAIAISRVAAGLGASVEIAKILRCSTPLASMADALSKANFSKFWAINNEIHLNLPLNQAWVPPSLLLWINKPTPDDLLGDKILSDISKHSLVLGLNC